MALWNPNDLIPSPVRDVVGVVGLTALGLAAVAVVVASLVVSRRPAGGTDKPTSAYLPLAWGLAKVLVILGMMLLLTWSLPWVLAHSNQTGPAPIGRVAW